MLLRHPPETKECPWTDIDEIIDQPFSSVGAAEFRKFLRKASEPGNQSRPAHGRSHGLLASDVPRVVTWRSQRLVGRSPLPPTGPTRSQEATSLFLAQCEGCASFTEIAERLAWPLAFVYAAAHACMGGLLEIARYDAPRQRMPLLEVCRWPTAEHLVPLEYWSNAIEVRQQIDSLPAALGNEGSFFRHLRRLHVISLMGAKLDSFYLPSSAFNQLLGGRHVGPGEFRPEAIIQCTTNNAWHARLAMESWGEAGGSCDNGPAVSDGLILGETRWTWQNLEADAGRHVFNPVGSMGRGHLRLLYSHLRDTVSDIESCSGTALPKIAETFRIFICLHPFAYGNLGLAMNIINWSLRRLLGGYIPHAMLDAWAHRMDRRQFGRFFEKYVECYLVRDGNEDEILRVERLIDRLLAFVNLPSEQSARAWLRDHAKQDRSTLLLS